MRRRVLLVNSFGYLACASHTTIVTPSIERSSTRQTPPPPPEPHDAEGDDAPPVHDPHDPFDAYRLPALLTKANCPSDFPKRARGDQECWQGVRLSGDQEKDYAGLVSSCGHPTGLLPYTKPVVGKLRHTQGGLDSYSIRLMAGFCYRYFAVGDDAVKDLSVVVEKTNGALVAATRQRQPVAIVKTDGPWCMEEDIEYVFHVRVEGEGDGSYTFSAWARPNR